MTQDSVPCLWAIRKHVMSWALDTGAKANREDRHAAGTRAVGSRIGRKAAGNRFKPHFQHAFCLRVRPEADTAVRAQKRMSETTPCCYAGRRD